MRITHEADYAVRIAYVLASENKMLPARQFSSVQLSCSVMSDSL